MSKKRYDYYHIGDFNTYCTIKWKKYRIISRKQGGTLDYKHYFDFFNNNI